MTRKQSLIGLFIFFLFFFAIAGLGGYLTSMTIKDWYLTVEKPSFNPPNIVFPIVWNILYALLSLSVWTLWKEEGGKIFTIEIGLFILQLLMNVAWSGLFFALQRIDWALIHIIAMTLLAWPTLVMFYRKSKLAGLLMTPYVMWLSFATFLNYSIWQLN